MRMHGLERPRRLSERSREEPGLLDNEMRAAEALHSCLQIWVGAGKPAGSWEPSSRCARNLVAV